MDDTHIRVRILGENIAEAASPAAIYALGAGGARVAGALSSVVAAVTLSIMTLTPGENTTYSLSTTHMSTCVCAGAGAGRPAAAGGAAPRGRGALGGSGGGGGDVSFKVTLSGPPPPAPRGGAHFLDRLAGEDDDGGDDGYGGYTARGAGFTGGRGRGGGGWRGGRGGRGGGGGGRGRSFGTSKSAAELDNDLEAYMSRK